MKNLHFEIARTIKILEKQKSTIERQNLTLAVKLVFELAHKQLVEAPLSIIHIPDPLIWRGINNFDNDVFIYLYKVLLPRVEGYVVKNKGNADIAKDIFQETMVDVLVRAKAGNFNIKSSAKNYITKMAINKWISFTKESKKNNESSIDINNIGHDPIDTLEAPDNYEVISKWLGELSGKCKVLIHEFYTKRENWETIAANLGYKDAKTARQQKYKCMERLKDNLRK